MSTRAPRPLSEAIGRLTDRLAPPTLLSDVQRVWPEAAGELVAEHAEPIAERDGVLTVACASGVWAQELELMGDEVVARLNAALGRPAVSAVRCRATGADRRPA